MSLSSFEADKTVFSAKAERLGAQGSAEITNRKPSEEISRFVLSEQAKGAAIGRPRSTAEDIPAVFLRHYTAYKEGRMNVSELARICQLSRGTVYKYLRLLG